MGAEPREVEGAEPGLGTPWGQTPPASHHPLMGMRMVRTFPVVVWGCGVLWCRLTVRVVASTCAEAANAWVSQVSRGVCRSAVAAATCPWSLQSCGLALGSLLPPFPAALKAKLSAEFWC